MGVAVGDVLRQLTRAAVRPDCDSNSSFPTVRAPVKRDDNSNEWRQTAAVAAAAAAAAAAATATTSQQDKPQLRDIRQNFPIPYSRDPIHQLSVR